MISQAVTTLIVSLAVVAVVWPALLVRGRYVDDPDNYLGWFTLGVLILVWRFL